MSHASLKEINRSFRGGDSEYGKPLTDRCSFCGANEMQRNVGYRGCIYCRRGGEWGRPIGSDSVREASTAEWIAYKERTWPGGFSAFCKHFNLDEAKYRKEASNEEHPNGAA